MREIGLAETTAPGNRLRFHWTGCELLLERLARGSRRGGDPSPLPFDLPELDRVLGGGLLRSALHEVTPAAEGDATAAAGFCAALLARALASGKKPVLWVRHEFATLEDGAPYGPGLAAFGLDPGRVLFVLAVNAREILEAMEQALRSGTLAAVLGELRGTSKHDLRATRRLSLAAAHGRNAGPAPASRGARKATCASDLCRDALADCNACFRRSGGKRHRRAALRGRARAQPPRPCSQFLS